MAEGTILLPMRPLTVEFGISSPFGAPRTPNPPHRGIDFDCPIGTPVSAMVDGVVFRSGWERDPNMEPNYQNIGFGLRVWQTFTLNGEKFFAWYGHLSQAFVNEGDKIKAGDVVGLSGATGRTYSSHRPGPAPHLHVQVRKCDTNDFYNIDWLKLPNEV